MMLTLNAMKFLRLKLNSTTGIINGKVFDPHANTNDVTI